MGIGGKAVINVTPMIDILLVMIIIFMLLTPLKPDGLEAKVPQRPEGKSAHMDDIVVTVCANDGVRINLEPVTLADLGARLADLYRNHPSHVLFVRAEGDPRYEQVARVIDIARGAGLERVALMPRGTASANP